VTDTAGPEREIEALRARNSALTGAILRAAPANLRNSWGSRSGAIYASVLFVLGMADRLGGLADAACDPIGLSLEEERLPRRIRTPRAK